MSSSLTRISLLRTNVRGYCQLAPVCGTTTYDVKTTVLPTKTVVASADNSSPIARVSILFKAGSRNEQADNYGAAHAIRIAAGLSTRNSSQFIITRSIQQVGAVLSCTSDRETIAYTLEGTRSAIEKCMPFLTDVATGQVFKPWELSDNIHRLKLELAMRPPQQKAIDLLHKAAYRTGLGNSLYISKDHIKNVNTETLQHYVCSFFKSDRCAVFGLGVDQSQLVQYANCLALERGDAPMKPSKYYGGEIRKEKGGEMAYVAIGAEGGSLKNIKEVLAFGVLQRILGVGPSVRYGNDTNGLLSKAAGSTSFPYSISCLNINYSDSGLFGALIIGHSCAIKQLVQGTVSVLKKANISDKDVCRGKNQLKTDLLSTLESGANAIEILGTQAVQVGVVSSPCQIERTIDELTPAEIQAAYKKVSSSRLSMAAVGALDNVPYLDEVGC